MAFTAQGYQLNQSVTPNYLQWGGQQNVNQSLAVPLNQQGMANAMNFENQGLNMANQQVLAQQGGITSDALLQQQPQVAGMQTGDMLNFGLSAASTLGGMYYQGKTLDQGDA